MNERPILFSGPMIRALLDGRKTQTRRIVKPQPPPDTPASVKVAAGVTMFGGARHVCPYGGPGDRLWVRETWRVIEDGCMPSPGGSTHCVVEYEADGLQRSYQLGDKLSPFYADNRRRPSIHMPRWASRLTLTITDMREQRVQDISEADAEAEGFSADDIITTKGNLGPFPCEMTGDAGSARRSFFNTFFALNTGRVPADANPWVWALEFERITP